MVVPRWIVWTLGAILCNLIIGAIALATADDKEHRLYRWYADCPPRLAAVFQPLVLMLWPVVLWFWFRGKRRQ